jgi:hypothetical protein
MERPLLQQLANVSVASDHRSWARCLRLSDVELSLAAAEEAVWQADLQKGDG